MAESGPPQYHAVYLVPFWDDFVYEDDDDDDDDDHWGHQGYCLVGPFGVYEARADADRQAKAVSRHVLAVLSGTDGIDSSWALSHALPADCVAHVRSFGEEADFVLRALDRAFHAKLRACAARMLEPKRAKYLETIRKRAKSFKTLRGGSKTAANRNAQKFFRQALHKSGLSDDDPASVPERLEAWFVSLSGRDLARFLGHDKVFQCAKSKWSARCHQITQRGGELHFCGSPKPLISVDVQSIDAPSGAGATLYAMVGRRERCSQSDYFDGELDDDIRCGVLGLAWEPGDVSTALVRHVVELLEDWEICKDDTQQSLWKTVGDEDFGFYEEPVDSSVLFADAPLPRACAFREAMRIHDDSGAFEGFQTRDAGTVAMPAAPVDTERGDAPYDTDYQYFIHATRLDGAGLPVARGFVVTEQDHQTCTDNLIVWPEAVPFHRATPAPA